MEFFMLDANGQRQPAQARVDSSGRLVTTAAIDAASVTQAVAYTTSAQSAAFAAATTQVRLTSTTDAYVAFGANPTATNANFLLPALTPTVFTVTGGQKVAALQVTSGGTLNVAEIG
jgi:hypothetical protein